MTINDFKLLKQFLKDKNCKIFKDKDSNLIRCTTFDNINLITFKSEYGQMVAHRNLIIWNEDNHILTKCYLADRSLSYTKYTDIINLIEYQLENIKQIKLKIKQHSMKQRINNMNSDFE